MHISNISCYAGKNIYSRKPVIRFELDIGDLYDTPTKDIRGFNERLLKEFPGLLKHCCSLGYEGGFVERLKEGTYIAHVTEHLILEIQTILGYEVSYGKARLLQEPSLYYIIFEYANECTGIGCAKAAVDIVSSFITGGKTDVQEIIAELRRISVETDLGPSTKAIYEEARRRGIPVARIGNESLLQLGYGKYKRLIAASLTDGPSCINVDIAGNKQVTKAILGENKIPVPDGGVAYTHQLAVQLAEEIGYPVVVKPLDGNQGKGVTLNIKSSEEVIVACEEAFKHSKAVIVEKQVSGKDYRVLVIGNKVVAVSERKPPYIVGDGTHTIRELVDSVNKDDRRGDDHEKPLTRIKLDTVAKEVLRRAGMDENYIPKTGEEVMLRENGNLSTGGTARNCIDEIHPFNRMMAIKAAKTVGLDIAGIDMTVENISIPLNQSKGAVIEVNAAPGLRMHLYPTEGEGIDVAAEILDMMYPEGKPFTIPIVSITGTNGKTTTTRLIKHAFSLMGKKVGMTSTSGVYIGNECILKGDNTGPISARMVLSNKEVEVAVLETARGGIVRKGLGYEAADVGVIVNISEDHLGLEGINTLEDLAFVKAVVIEAVKPTGYAILNADDPMTPYFINRVKSNILLFARNSDNELLQSHRAKDGKAVYIEDGTIVMQSGKAITSLVAVDEIPITIGGIVECNIENSLAAVSTLFAMGVPAEIIKQALVTFKPNLDLNPGRFNIFDIGTYKVMLDYSHNIAGYNAVINFAKKMKCKRVVGIIGMPGDRLDSNIKEVGDICGKAFSKLYIKEDNDLRERDAGEVADILFEAAIKSGAKKENIQVIYSETKALEAAIQDAEPGDLIIMFYEEFEPAVALINQFKKELEQRDDEKGLMEETAG